jgi:hypothetical protein
MNLNSKCSYAINNIGDANDKLFDFSRFNNIFFKIVLYELKPKFIDDSTKKEPMFAALKAKTFVHEVSLFSLASDFHHMGFTGSIMSNNHNHTVLREFDYSVVERMTMVVIKFFCKNNLSWPP